MKPHWHNTSGFFLLHLALAFIGADSLAAEQSMSLRQLVEKFKVQEDIIVCWELTEHDLAAFSRPSIPVDQTVSAQTIRQELSKVGFAGDLEGGVLFVRGKQAMAISGNPMSFPVGPLQYRGSLDQFTTLVCSYLPGVPTYGGHTVLGAATPEREVLVDERAPDATIRTVLRNMAVRNRVQWSVSVLSPSEEVVGSDGKPAAHPKRHLQWSFYLMPLRSK